MERDTVIVASIGSDTHIVGVTLLSRALEKAGFRAVNLGVQNTLEELINGAVETKAVGIWASSLCGHAELDCIDFRAKCTEAGLKDIILYIGGNLVVGKRDWEETKLTFEKMGFDRVYPPGAPPEQAIDDLKRDLQSPKGSLSK